MSVITEVLLIGADDGEVLVLNEMLREANGRQQFLRKIDMDNAGGTKFFVVSVWAAAFNYFGSHQFLPIVEDWSSALGGWDCILLYRDEDDEGWTKVDLR